jgi:hypothetical protein
MKIIITESQLKRIIENYNELDEIDLTGTYLDPELNKYDYSSNQKSIAPKAGGKIFSGNSLSGEITFKVDNQNQVFGSGVNYGIHISPSLIDSLQIPPGLNNKEWLNHKQSIKKYLRTENVGKIMCLYQGTLNRIHFTQGISEVIRGLGLGYHIFKEFIKFLGWGTSAKGSTDAALNIWRKLLNDPDFYGVVTKSENDKSNSLLVIYKNFDFKEFKPDDIVINFLKFRKKQDNDFKFNKESVIIDDKLLNNYPRLKNVQDELSFGQLGNTYFDDNEKRMMDKKNKEEKLKKFLDNLSFIIYGINNLCNQETDIDFEYKNWYNKRIEKIKNEISNKDISFIRLKPKTYFLELEYKLECNKSKEDFPNVVELNNKMAELMKIILNEYNS